MRCLNDSMELCLSVVQFQHQLCVCVCALGVCVCALDGWRNSIKDTFDGTLSSVHMYVCTYYTQARTNKIEGKFDFSQ